MNLRQLKTIVLSAGLLTGPALLWAQPAGTAVPGPDTTGKVSTAPANWFNLDRATDRVTGVSTEKAYELLRNKTSRPVVVAVIDGGVDVKHEDLQGKLWINPKETAGNGVDDDKNGFVDDVYGWNFIGGKDGRNVNEETYELTRQYVALKKRFEGTKKVRRRDKAAYAEYQQIKETFETKVAGLKKQAEGYLGFAKAYKSAAEYLKTYLGKDSLTAADVDAIRPANQQVGQAQKIVQYAFENGINEKELKEAEEYFEKALNYGYNTEFDARKVVGDDPNNLAEKGYGNNDVIGPDARHGSHVAGIIAANRSNETGIKGVADNVQIMAIRAVPDGDERDKDVANAIRYAVDNGAQIINMSFGKDYSPDKAYVDEAVRYAVSKGVLLVHAAGNDAENIDTARNFPTRRYANGGQETAQWLEIGASSWGGNDNFVGDFSNYGKQTVDVFAPGVDVYSTTPGSKYESLSGTSMAAPVTSGVAALLMSYYPQLTAAQVKDIIVKSSVKYAGEKVNKPGEEKDQTISFGDLSISGGVVNAYEAVKLAESMAAQK
ncbi:MAG: Protease precursor [uncultured Cytophagales bacterium]|uniref:Protease n=1 Tax=uncultured Cytophagales bacterium TaxID=158755 RepID=A0A6J4KM58_9SPHI|nr:MAG: Protease precursor [uncultured Cytophagales bacterium]